MAIVAKEPTATRWRIASGVQAASARAKLARPSAPTPAAKKPRGRNGVGRMAPFALCIATHSTPSSRQRMRLHSLREHGWRWHRRFEPLAALTFEPLQQNEVPPLERAFGRR